MQSCVICLVVVRFRTGQPRFEPWEEISCRPAGIHVVWGTSSPHVETWAIAVRRSATATQTFVALTLRLPSQVAKRRQAIAPDFSLGLAGSTVFTRRLSSSVRTVGNPRRLPVRCGDVRSDDWWIRSRNEKRPHDPSTRRICDLNLRERATRLELATFSLGS